MNWCKSEWKSFHLVPEVIWHEMVLFPVATPMPRHRIHLQHSVSIFTNLAFIRYYFNFVHNVDIRCVPMCCNVALILVYNESMYLLQLYLLPKKSNVDPARRLSYAIRCQSKMINEVSRRSNNFARGLRMQTNRPLY